jgi:hypothetical protein
MPRNPEQRMARQQALHETRAELAHFEEEQEGLLGLGEAAADLGVSRSTARRLLRNEPGVYLLRTPGSSRPIIRVERAVIQRLLRRSANR